MMELSKKESLKFYESSFKNVGKDDFKQIINNFMAETNGFNKKDCLVYIGKEHYDTYPINDSDELESCVVSIGVLFYSNKYINLTLKCDKTTDTAISILCSDTFIKSMKEVSYLEQLRDWLNITSSNISEINFNGNDIELEYYNIHASSSQVIENRSNHYIDFANFNLKPCFFDFLSNKVLNQALIKYFKELRSIICLSLLSKDFDLNKSNCIFHFEGDVIFDLSGNDDNFLSNNSDCIYNVFKWSYNDEKYVVKVGIVNQLISKSRNIKLAFNDGILASLSSLYQIHLREDFENYLEIRNKVSDSIMEQCNKISESIYQSRSGVKQTLFVTMSYFFSIFVFTAIDKGKIVNLFSLHVCLLSSLFLIVSTLIVFFNKKELETIVEHQKDVLDEIKQRNQILLCPDEIDAFFNSKSLKNAITLSESKKLEILSYSVFALSFVLIWYFYFTKESFVSLPVYLHIV
ncbi:hypothetical protein C9J03_11925 [Photobacterium gaetbulicola]|uniref:Uncharacterized protein n=1 Tax=Photobacterium gaetbulicola Gung47 TaxID=658445 RepID=A0A0C5WUA9_9GAMM|nr:hypothetical protein [Photobacterium gaetbulicola]AJR08664.1 hypothetical protein H744_2c2000 [Photobacterium gaetbulicola Gung47]PSU10291.1 hypothetical protein C9J03_11925 [Photobacterium gaetbulicola]